MSAPIVQEYVSIGGNRHSAASSWSRQSAVLAFGADQNVAIWDPLNPDSIGIQQLLHGHKDRVTAIAFLIGLQRETSEYLLSGSADGRLMSWSCGSSQKSWHHQREDLEVEAHKGAINCIATFPGSEYFVTGGADAKVKLWRVSGHQGIVELLTITPTPRLIPLTLVLGPFPKLSFHDGMFLALGGTRNDAQIYALRDLLQQPIAEHQATLTGHEGWIRSLCLKVVNEQELLLASASHDKYVRLWKFKHGDKDSKSSADYDQATSLEQTLTAKVKVVFVADSQFAITFEALLLGHEDWVYSAAWNPAVGSEQLLTASADGSLTIWELDSTSGIWISASRLGEISGQKGATTATGSSGGFWTGMWSADGQYVTCLGRTGSWRLWQFDQAQQYWVQKHGISGHVSAANGLTWSPSGDYLLSTSSDQTTRLHAEWKRGPKRTWHEFARPQIHGYDLNCISSTGDHQFASGADEKLLRVFNEPKDIAGMLKGLCSIEEPNDNDLSETAAIPVLGLSNKAMVDSEDASTELDGKHNQDYITSDLEISVATITEPPTEDLLARHTLWPEHEKLYGHGYEISESAFSLDNQILATACKASSVDHAVIRLYNTKDWNEIKPPLAAHTLTVTRLAWSHFPDNYLLSVGRDRQWAVFKQDIITGSWKLLQLNPKAHSRMILDAAWSPIGGNPFFATAGRDKMVKLWRCKHPIPDDELSFEESSTIKRETAVTALSFMCNEDNKSTALAVGEESGALSIHVFDVDQHLTLVKSVNIDNDIGPSKAITRIAWRTSFDSRPTAERTTHLAVAAADGSVRVLAIRVVENMSQIV